MSRPISTGQDDSFVSMLKSYSADFAAYKCYNDRVMTLFKLKIGELVQMGEMVAGRNRELDENLKSRCYFHPCQLCDERNHVPPGYAYSLSLVPLDRLRDVVGMTCAVPGPGSADEIRSGGGDGSIPRSIPSVQVVRPVATVAGEAAGDVAEADVVPKVESGRIDSPDSANGMLGPVGRGASWFDRAADRAGPSGGRMVRRADGEFSW